MTTATSSARRKGKKLTYNPSCPVICIDEQPVQLVKETRVTLPAKPGQPKAVDYEYERNGTANIFIFTEPLTGWRKVVVSERRTAIDWAGEIQRLLEHDYAHSEQVIVVCDQLNIHRVASFTSLEVTQALGVTITAVGLTFTTVFLT